MERLVLFVLLCSRFASSTFLEIPGKSFPHFKYAPVQGYFNPAGYAVIPAQNYYPSPVGFVQRKSVSSFANSFSPLIYKSDSNSVKTTVDGESTVSAETLVSSTQPTVPKAATLQTTIPNEYSTAVYERNNGSAIRQHEISSVRKVDHLPPRTHVETTTVSTAVNPVKEYEVDSNVLVPSAQPDSSFNPSLVIKDALSKKFEPYGGEVHVYEPTDAPINTYEVSKSDKLTEGTRPTTLTLEPTTETSSVATQTLHPTTVSLDRTTPSLSSGAGGVVKEYQVHSVAGPTKTPVFSVGSKFVSEGTSDDIYKLYGGKVHKTTDSQFPVSTSAIHKAAHQSASGAAATVPSKHVIFSGTPDSVIAQYEVSPTLSSYTRSHQKYVRSRIPVSTSGVGGHIKEYPVHVNVELPVRSSISGTVSVIPKTLTKEFQPDSAQIHVEKSDGHLQTSTSKVSQSELKKNCTCLPLSVRKVEQSPSGVVLSPSFPIKTYKVDGVNVPEVHQPAPKTSKVSEDSKPVISYKVLDHVTVPGVEPAVVKVTDNPLESAAFISKSIPVSQSVPNRTYKMDGVKIAEVHQPAPKTFKVSEDSKPVLSYKVLDRITESSLPATEPTPAAVKLTDTSVKSAGFISKSIPVYPIVAKSSNGQFLLPFLHPVYQKSPGNLVAYPTLFPPSNLIGSFES